MGTEKGNDPGNDPGKASKPRKTDKPTRPTVKHGRLAYFPAAAIDDSRVSFVMLAVLAALSSHCSRSGYADVSASSIGARLGHTRSYISRLLSDLETLGYLRSVRRKMSDGRETTKAYKLILDYDLPPQFFRYLPSDYGSEPEEAALEAAFALPPVPTVGTPPVPTVGTPPVPTVGTPPVPTVGTRTIGINDRLDVDVEEGAQAREVARLYPSLGLCREVSENAHLSASANPKALADLLADMLAAGLTANDLRLAATDCAEWYDRNRHTTPRLGNLVEWLRREKLRRADMAEEEVANHAQPVNDPASNPTANPTNASARRASDPASGASGARPQARRARRQQSRRADGEHSGPDEPSDAAAAWRPGQRVFVPDDPSDPDSEWGYVITESGRRVRYSQRTGYVNPAEAWDSEQAEPDAAAAT